MLLHQLNNRICRHCGAIASFFILMAHEERIKRPVGDGRIEWIESNALRVFVCCSICRQPSMLALKPKGNIGGNPMQSGMRPHCDFLNRLRPLSEIFQNAPENIRANWGVVGTAPGTNIDNFYEVLREFPDGAVQRPNASDIPDAVNVQLNSLVNILHEPTYAMMGCRKTLEVACKVKLGDAANGKRLYELIDLALAQLDATKEISAWATTIRHLGNDAVHDVAGEVSTEEAQQAYEVVKLILDLLFAYPQKVRALRGTQ